MNNPQGEVKTYKHGACRVCGHGLNAEGKCFLFPFHSQEPDEAEVPMMGTVIPMRNSQAQVKDESMPVETQLCLSEELFERYEVEGVRFSVSGGCELAADTVGLVAGEGLEPGMDVVIVCRGHVRDVSAPFKVKDRSHSGRVVIAVEVVERVTEIRRGE